MFVIAICLILLIRNFNVPIIGLPGSSVKSTSAPDSNQILNTNSLTSKKPSAATVALGNLKILDVWQTVKLRAINNNECIETALANHINLNPNIDTCHQLIIHSIITAENDFDYLMFCDSLKRKKLRDFAVATLSEELLNRDDYELMHLIYNKAKDERMRLAMTRELIAYQVSKGFIDEAFSFTADIPYDSERNIAIGQLACELYRNNVMTDANLDALLHHGITQNQLRTASFYKPPPTMNLFSN